MHCMFTHIYGYVLVITTGYESEQHNLWWWQKPQMPGWDSFTSTNASNMDCGIGHFFKKNKPKSTKNWKKFWRGFIFSPLSPCASVFACLLLACAVSAMLCEVVASGVSSSVKSGGVDGEKVKGDMDFDVVLCQSELIERALQLCHLLPPGFLPVGLNSYHSSHTQPCVSLSGCLIEPNGHSSCSAARIFGRKRVHIFVCTSSVHSCVIATRVRPPTDFIAPKNSARLFSASFCLPFVSTAPPSCLCSSKLWFLPHFST